MEVRAEAEVSNFDESKCDVTSLQPLNTHSWNHQLENKYSNAQDYGGIYDLITTTRIQRFHDIFKKLL